MFYNVWGLFLFDGGPSQALRSIFQFLSFSRMIGTRDIIPHSRVWVLPWYLLLLYYSSLRFSLKKHIADGTVFLPLVNADTAILWVRERSRSILKRNRWLQHLTVSLISPQYWCGDTEPCHWMGPAESICSRPFTFWHAVSEPSERMPARTEVCTCKFLRDYSPTVSVWFWNSQAW